MPSPPCLASASLAPVPWMIQTSGAESFTESADPRNVYRDALIVLDAAKRLNNGQPSLWAFHLSLLDVHPGDHILHLGCGAGYYTAILAELVGPNGKVIAVEIDEALAARARIALEPWPQVTVIHADGAQGPFDPADVIVVSAGATHPLPAWLAALKPEGKLLFPLTSTRGPGTSPTSPAKAPTFLRRCSAALSSLSISRGRANPPSVTNWPATLKRDHGAACALFAAKLTKKTNPAGCTATAGASRAARPSSNLRSLNICCSHARLARLLAASTAPAPATSPCASADSPQSPPACPPPQSARRPRRPPVPDRSPNPRS